MAFGKSTLRIATFGISAIDIQVFGFEKLVRYPIFCSFIWGKSIAIVAFMISMFGKLLQDKSVEMEATLSSSSVSSLKKYTG